MRAFLVLGPESSATRLTTRILIKNGCYGDGDNVQRLDTGGIEGDPIVWRRSVPYASKWLKLSRLLERLRSYDVIAVVTTRDWSCLVQSQVNRGHALTPAKGLVQTQHAMELIFSELYEHEVPFIMSSYESLILHPERAQRGLIANLGLPFKGALDIKDMNDEKWEQIEQ